MAAAKSVLCSSLIQSPRSNNRNSLAPSTISQHFPASVFLQEHDLKTSLQYVREDRTLQATLDKRQMDKDALLNGEKIKDLYLKDFHHQLLYWPGLWYLLPPFNTDEIPLSSSARESTQTVDLIAADRNPVSEHCNPVEPLHALLLAKKAVVALRESISLTKYSSLLDEHLQNGLRVGNLAHKSNTEEGAIVRSHRLMERQSKKRMVPKKLNARSHKAYSKIIKDGHNAKSFDLSDPFRLFLFGPETKQLLSAKEEQELFIQIEDLKKLEEVKEKLWSQFDREPTLIEWAKAVEVTAPVLQAQIKSGERSREKMLYSNFRLVIHIAKLYQGKGLGIQDLLQVGSKGLMKSVEKFKPQAGCRFSTYAYWWVRQAIKREICLNSRTIRLPENVYSLMKQVKIARRTFIQRGHLPTNEEVAKTVGISVVKLERILQAARDPVSIQQHVWGSDQDATFQEITADPDVERGDVIVAKQLMRRHVRNLLTVLTPKERAVIRLRYGIHDGERKSLSEIGVVLGICKERVRQVQNKAIDKLKRHLSSEGLERFMT